MKRFLPQTARLAFERFFAQEASSGILLSLFTVLAMVFANGDYYQQYHSVLQAKFFLSIHHWINDGLMVIFFFVVGLEIKKELVAGELSTPKKAMLPIVAALGGMIAPALIYLYFNPSYPDNKGWGIPMATDIAFAVGILSFFGKRVPLALKVFLLALAIVDDLGAVLVIALFYTSKIHGLALLGAFILLGIIYFCQRKQWSSYLLYSVLGVGVWLCFLASGVHATIAGVILGLMTPLYFSKNEAQYSPLSDLVHRLHPYVSFGIMPLFALANAGVRVVDVDLLQVFGNPVFQGIGLGLFLGKILGIFSFSFLVVKLGFAQLPEGVRWAQIAGISILGGIGFTMALFISSLALYPEQEVYSKSGILSASLLSTLVGSVVLHFSLHKEKSRES